MPVIKELQDIVNLLGEHDRAAQQAAVKKLMIELEFAEQNIADSYLSPEDRRQVRRERHMIRYERRFGKQAADELRAKIEEIIRQLNDDE